MAEYGIVIRDPATGFEVFRLSRRITRMVGVISTGASAGSVTIPDSISGNIWFAPVIFPRIVAFGQSPAIIPSGRTISWTANCYATFTYGVY